MKKIKRDDEVVVIAGKDKGKRGKVLRVVGEDRLIIGGINLVKKHTKPNPQRGIQGGIVQQEASIHQSNVAIWNSGAQKADRVGFRFEEGKKVRFFKGTNELLSD